MLTLLVLFQSGVANLDTDKSPSACYCQPVINVSGDGKGQCDLCKENKQLLQEVNDLKKELTTLTHQLRQIIQPGEE